MDKAPALPEFLDNICVVLVRTSHPGNIGSAARAMKTMGLSQLVLVSPQLMATPMTPEPPVFDAAHPFRLPEESFILASGARDVLDNAKIVSDLHTALSEATLSCALTSRRRELSLPLQTPKELTPDILARARRGEKIVLVFGNETFGLSIEEASACNRIMTISGNPNYFSLNLAQAVQVVTYELFSQLQTPLEHLQPALNPATHEQVQGMVAHLEALMQEVDFFERRESARLMRRVQRLFHRAAPEKEEIDILRGLFSSIQKKIDQSRQ